MSLFIQILFLSLLGGTQEEKIESIVIVPGNCIIINADSFMLKRITLTQAMDKLGITEEPKLQSAIWDGVDQQGKPVWGQYYSRTLIIENVKLEFRGLDTNSFFLEEATVEFNDAGNDIEVFLNNKLLQRNRASKIVRLYPFHPRVDYASRDRLTYNIYSAGFSLSFRKGVIRKRLQEIRVHSKIPAS